MLFMPNINNNARGGGREPHIVDTIKVVAIDEQNMSCKEDVFGTLTTDGSSPKHNNRVAEILNIKQATKTGSIPYEIGGVFDGSFPNSKNRRGRVQGGGQICPTLTTQGTEVYRMEICECNEKGAVMIHVPETDSYYLVRIRKLTPKECGRLMGVSDENIDKMAAVSSNTQLYKCFGNSIVVDCMKAMFSQLGFDNIKKWNEVQ